MTTMLITMPWFLVLVLVWCLLVGQPAGIAAERQAAATSAAQATSLSMTVQAYPHTPVPAFCYYGTRPAPCSP